MKSDFADFIVYAGGSFLFLFAIYCFGVFMVLCVQEAIDAVLVAVKKRRLL